MCISLKREIRHSLTK